MTRGLSAGLCLFALTAGCGGLRSGGRGAVDQADDVLRIFARNEAALTEAATRSRQMSVTLRSRGQAAPVVAQVDSLVVEEPARYRDAVRSLAWDVACDAVGGTVPRTKESIGRYLLDKAAVHGVGFVDEEAGALAEHIVAGLDTAAEHEDVRELCELTGEIASQ